MKRWGGPGGECYILVANPAASGVVCAFGQHRMEGPSLAVTADVDSSVCWHALEVWCSGRRQKTRHPCVLASAARTHEHQIVLTKHRPWIVELLRQHYPQYYGGKKRRQFPATNHIPLKKLSKAIPIAGRGSPWCWDVEDPTFSRQSNYICGEIASLETRVKKKKKKSSTQKEDRVRSMLQMLEVYSNITESRHFIQVV
jgi:hypothetical protein